MPHADPTADLSWQEVRALLDEQLQQLPDECRAALVLCYLEGKTHDDAAHQLGWTKATLRRRLGQGRELLRLRLVRRGLSLSAALIATLLAESTTRAAVPVCLAKTTVHAALQLAGGKALAAIASAPVANLVKSGLPGVLSTPVKVATALLLTLGVLATAGVLSQPTTAAREAAPAAARANKTEAADAVLAAAKSDRPRTTVEAAGRVLDPDGKPVTGAKVFFVRYTVRNRNRPAPVEEGGRALSGSDGRFRFDIDLSGEAGEDMKKGWTSGQIVAVREGFGPAVVDFRQADELGSLTLKLARDDVPIKGRVLDLEGKPVAGVTVRVTQFVLMKKDVLPVWLKALGTQKQPHTMYPAIYVEAGTPSLGLSAVTGTDGRFRLTGIGRDRLVGLRFEGPTIVATQAFALTGPAPDVMVPRREEFGSSAGFIYHGATFDHVAAPTKPVFGVVRDKDTNQPLAGFRVESFIIAGAGRFAQTYLHATTDPQGRYRLVGLPKGPGNEMRVLPSPEQPYFASVKRVSDSPGLDPVRLDFELKRGIPVQGRVTDRATGQPVRATVDYFAFITNPNLRQAPGFRGSGHVQAHTAADGTFHLLALPGRGLLAAKAEPDREARYLVGAGAEQIAGMERSDFVTDPYICNPKMFNSLVEIYPEKGASSVTKDLTLDPGKTVHGSVVGPDGKPLTGASIQGAWGIRYAIDRMPNAQFAIPAINPKRPQPFFFLHREKHLGAVVILKGDEPESFTVRLQPTATLTGRLVDADGDPRANVNLSGFIEPGQLHITEGWGGIFNTTTKKDGRFRVENVLPGIHYTGWIQKTYRITGTIFKNLTLKPGETHDLGDIKETSNP